MKEYNMTVAYLNWVKGELAPKPIHNSYVLTSTQYFNFSLHDFVRYHPWFIDVHTELLKELRSKPIPSAPIYTPFWGINTGSGISTTTTITMPDSSNGNYLNIITNHFDDYT